MAYFHLLHSEYDTEVMFRLQYRYDVDVLLRYQYIFSFIKLYLVACDLYFDSHKLLYLIITLILISYFICINCIIVREYHRYFLTANKSLF